MTWNGPLPTMGGLLAQDVLAALKSTAVGLPITSLWVRATASAARPGPKIPSGYGKKRLSYCRGQTSNELDS